jgi:hypothetical protein
LPSVEIFGHRYFGPIPACWHEKSFFSGVKPQLLFALLKLLQGKMQSIMEGHSSE